MLGQMAMKYFGEKGYSINTIPYRFDSTERNAFLNELLKYPDAVILNCIGKIKQKTEDDNELLWANAFLPLALVNRLLPSQTLVHPSTDCVYDGMKGEAYLKNDSPDAEDTYGWSKRLGEVAVLDRPNTIVFRVSIIGPDNNPNGKGLLGWFLGNKEGAELKGFENHYWNGITTLEWCKQIEQLLQIEDLADTTLFEIGGTRESYTKFEMLELFQKTYNTKFKISSFSTAETIDRRLYSTLISKSLQEQLKELKGFE